jgi:hypothetical protein
VGTSAGFPDLTLGIAKLLPFLTVQVKFSSAAIGTAKPTVFAGESFFVPVIIHRKEGTRQSINETKGITYMDLTA